MSSSVRAAAVATAGLLALAAAREPLPVRRPGEALVLTTAPEIALGNLEASLEQLSGKLERGDVALERAGELCELLATRGQFLARVTDSERALAWAERYREDAPSDPRAWLARARARAALHVFHPALEDLDIAARLGGEAGAVDATRAGILQALGRYDEAVALRARLARERPSTLSVGALAIALAESGALPAATERFQQARALFRDVSPLPLAWLDFQQGRLWMEAGRLDEARGFLEAAHARLPQYAAAGGHLGEVLSALGHGQRAVELLSSVAERAEDPDAAGQLARVLEQLGRRTEADVWHERAAAAYARLMARHPEAFADHAAEFWLGTDTRQALRYARINLALRDTPRARALVARAESALR